jgi:hypothetical protein
LLKNPFFGVDLMVIVRFFWGGSANLNILCLVRVYKLAKIFIICVSVQKVPVARLAKTQKTEFTLVNEYYGGERNAANGTLWTDTI